MERSLDAYEFLDMHSVSVCLSFLCGACVIFKYIPIFFPIKWHYYYLLLLLLLASSSLLSLRFDSYRKFTDLTFRENLFFRLLF